MSVLVDADMADDASTLYADVQAYYNAYYKLPLDVMWLVQSGVLVFLMHLGFMTLEAGSVQMKNKDNIIFKNFLTVAISAVSYWALGYGLAYGSGGFDAGSDGDRLIGSGSFFVEGGDLDNAQVLIPGDDPIPTYYGQGFFFFQWAFAATAATIVSGAVAGRIKLEAYFIVALYITAFVYPVVTHWVWSPAGWLSAFSTYTPLFADSYPFAAGMFDFAGSAVVHMTGGVAAFWGAYFLGPRAGFEEAKGHNLVLVFLGTMLLWFGWYGFNCGSTLAFNGLTTGKVAVTTTLAPSSAIVFGMFYLKVVRGTWDLVSVLNCALAGLVSITANCCLVDDWAAVPIGCIGALLYIYSSGFLKSKQIDDPVGAIAVHGVCGAWGAIAVGIFGNPLNVEEFYGAAAFSFFKTPAVEASDVFVTMPAFQLAVQVTGVVAIIAWVSLTTIPLFWVLKKFDLLRVSEAEELAGLDASEHGSTKVMSETILDASKP